MRIAVNARILQAPRTGIGHYLVELLGALQAHADFEFSLFHGWGWSGDLPAAALPGYSRLSPWLRNLPGAYRARRWLEQRRFDSGRPPVDLYHEPSLWPLDFDGPMLMTLHDLTHLHYPATQPAARLREIERRLALGRWSSPRSTKASACLCWKPWPAARQYCSRDSPQCRRWPARRAAILTRMMPMGYLTCWSA